MILSVVVPTISGRRFIEVYPATRDDMMRARRTGGRAFDGYGMMPPGPMRGPMRGGFRGGMGVSLGCCLALSVDTVLWFVFTDLSTIDYPVVRVSSSMAFHFVYAFCG